MRWFLVGLIGLGIVSIVLKTLNPSSGGKKNYRSKGRKGYKKKGGWKKKGRSSKFNDEYKENEENSGQNESQSPPVETGIKNLFEKQLRMQSAPSLDGGICYGYFECVPCKRKWKSGNSLAGQSQTCLSCKADVFPYKQINPQKYKRQPAKVM